MSGNTIDTLQNDILQQEMLTKLKLFFILNEVKSFNERIVSNYLAN